MRCQNIAHVLQRMTLLQWEIHLCKLCVCVCGWKCQTFYLNLHNDFTFFHILYFPFCILRTSLAMMLIYSAHKASGIIHTIQFNAYSHQICHNYWNMF
jgi:hypothetical protein